MNFDRVNELATSLGCEAEWDVPMCDYTTFKIGGKARLMITPSSDESLAEVIKVCKAEGIKPMIIGNGSNMLISDK